MKTFKQFLDESKWGNYLYHATYNDFDPKDIKPGSHFGTLRAAKARAHIRKKWADRLKVHAYKYERKPDAERIRASDDDANRIAKQPKPPAEISYKNKYEDPGSTSHIIHDVENLKPVHTFNKPKFINRK